MAKCKPPIGVFKIGSEAAKAETSQFARDEVLITRMAGALIRSLLVAIIIVFPALILRDSDADTTQIIVLIAFLAALLTFVEYNSSFPSIVEFRDAPPFNRLRFAALFTNVIVLTVIQKGVVESTNLTLMIDSFGTSVGNNLDFPFSPVRLVVLMLPDSATQATINSVRTAAGISYVTCLVALVAFIILVHLLDWPARKGAFNVWVNLPLFDPTAGGDVLHRLQRDSRVNIAIGFLLPFVIPALIKLTANLIDPIALEKPQTMIWTVTAWAFLPASIIMRGIAMGKVADMIKEKRRRAYADLEQEEGTQAA